MEVFISKGYQVATINDIASQASVSVGAIYATSAPKMS
jgi:AcrR family transcriptional regulator